MNFSSIFKYTEFLEVEPEIVHSVYISRSGSNYEVHLRERTPSERGSIFGGVIHRCAMLRLNRQTHIWAPNEIVLFFSNLYWINGNTTHLVCPNGPYERIRDLARFLLQIGPPRGFFTEEASRELNRHANMSAATVTIETHQIDRSRIINAMNQDNIDPLQAALNNGEANLLATLDSMIVQYILNFRNNTVQIDISLKELRENPDQVLLYLHQRLIIDHPQAIRLKVSLINEDGREIDGVDQGGVSRDFMDRFFEMVIKHSSLNFKKEIGGVLPVMASHSEQEIESYRTIGRIMGLCLNCHQYRIGSYFDQSFFDVLSLISKNETETGLNEELLLKIYLTFNKENSTIKKMFACLEETELTNDAITFAYPDLDGPAEPNLKDVKFKIRENLLDYASKDQSIPALVEITKGISDGFPQWDSLRLRGGEFLQKMIQGEISKDLLRQRFNCTEPVTNGYFQRWFDEASEDLIRKFVYTSIGSKTLGEKEITAIPGINLLTTRYPKYNTCGQIIRLPIYPSYNDFKDIFREIV